MLEFFEGIHGSGRIGPAAFQYFRVVDSVALAGSHLVRCDGALGMAKTMFFEASLGSANELVASAVDGGAGGPGTVQEWLRPHLPATLDAPRLCVKLH
eukprot:1737380-Alexandrium_andersonii.AAC.1